MARRKTSRKKPVRRQSKKGVNIVNAAELYITSSIITSSMFKANPIEFVTGRTFPVSNSTTRMTSYSYRPFADGNVLTLPELLGIDGTNTKPTVQVPFGGINPIVATVQANLASYGGLGKVATDTIIVKVGFTVAKKLLRKQRTAINKGIKMLGMKGTVSV